MADTTNRTRPNRTSGKRLKHACDAGILSETSTLNSEDCNNPPSSTHSACSESPPRLADLAVSFRIFAESIARMDLAKLEMIKAREASQLEAEKRRIELDTELTQMMLQTQLQVASIVAGKGTSGKRKRAAGEEEKDIPISSREGDLLLSLLQCNFLL